MRSASESLFGFFYFAPHQIGFFRPDNGLRFPLQVFNKLLLFALICLRNFSQRRIHLRDTLYFFTLSVTNIVVPPRSIRKRAVIFYHFGSYLLYLHSEVWKDFTGRRLLFFLELSRFNQKNRSLIIPQDFDRNGLTNGCGGQNKGQIVGTSNCFAVKLKNDITPFSDRLFQPGRRTSI